MTRKPATEAELAAIPVTDADIAHFQAMMRRVMDRVHRVGIDEADPNTGVAMLRTGCTACVLLGVPIEDARDFAMNTCQMLKPPPGKAPVMPQLVDATTLNALSRRLAVVVHGALRNESAADQAFAPIHVGIAYLRFAAHSTETVQSLFEACWKDSERAVAEMGARSGHRA